MLTNNLGKITRENKSTLVLTELEWNSWINKSNGFKLIYEAISKNNKFKSVVFACLTEDSQKLFMKIVQESIQSSQR